MINQSLQEQLVRLQILLSRVTDTAYTFPSVMLGGSTIGQHVRHILELIQCLRNGYDTGVVNYDDRKRDRRIETERDFARGVMDSLCAEIVRDDKPLLLTEPGSNGQSSSMLTGYFRELVYNAEHAVHHMAMIRVALRELGLDLVDENFGVAAATIQYKQSQVCVQ